MLCSKINKIFKHGKTPLFSFSSLENLDNIENWRQILNKKATTAQGKSSMGQLNSLLSYYNKESVDVIQDIDWDSWSKQIQTEGIVDKIKQNYEELQKEEYNKESAMQNVINSQSNTFRNINSELNYHRELWMMYLQDNIDFQVQFKNMPQKDDLTELEYLDYRLQDKVEEQRLQETGNFIPHTHQDQNPQAYTDVQFAWGKRVNEFWMHPAEDYRGYRGTIKIMSR